MTRHLGRTVGQPALGAWVGARLTGWGIRPQSWEGWVLIFVATILAGALVMSLAA